MNKTKFIRDDWRFLFIDAEVDFKFLRMCDVYKPKKFIYTYKDWFFQVPSLQVFDMHLHPHGISCMRFLSFGDSLFKDHDNNPHNKNFTYIRNSINHLIQYKEYIHDDLTIVYHGQNKKILDKLKVILEPIEEYTYFK